MPDTATATPEALKVGVSHERVGHLQNRLAALGHAASDPPGTFGPKTHGSVVAFQEKAGLLADGIVGPKTTEALVKGDELNHDKRAEEEEAKAAKPADAKAAAKPAAKKAADRLHRKIEIDHNGMVRVYYRGGGSSTAGGEPAAAGAVSESLDVAIPALTVLELAEAALELEEAKDSLKKASTPEPFSTSKTSNWVAKGGGLPAYIQHIAHDIAEKRGKTVSQAIQIAIGVVKRWAKGGGNVDSGTKAAAAKALGEWEKLKAGAGKAKAVTESRVAVGVARHLALAEAATLHAELAESGTPQNGGAWSAQSRADARDAAKRACPNCKRQVARGAAKCPNCSHKLEEGQLEEAARGSSRRIVLRDSDGKFAHSGTGRVLKAGDKIKATGHMSPSSGGRLLKGSLTVKGNDRGILHVQHDANGSEFHLKAPEVQHGAGPGHQLEVDETDAAHASQAAPKAAAKKPAGDWPAGSSPNVHDRVSVGGRSGEVTARQGSSASDAPKVRVKFDDGGEEVVPVAGMTRAAATKTPAAKKPASRPRRREKGTPEQEAARGERNGRMAQVRAKAAAKPSDKPAASPAATPDGSTLSAKAGETYHLKGSGSSFGLKDGHYQAAGDTHTQQGGMFAGDRVTRMKHLDSGNVVDVPHSQVKGWTKAKAQGGGDPAGTAERRADDERAMQDGTYNSPEDIERGKRNQAAMAARRRRPSR